MTHSKKITSQSGFMSVEAVATTLFYLIMVGVVTLIAAQFMNTGKMASSLNALSMLRVNLQYVGSSVGDYTDIAQINLASTIPGLLSNPGHDSNSNPTTTFATLPISRVVTVKTAAENDYTETPGVQLTATNAPSYFTMTISDVTTDECRKLAFYGIAGGYGVMGGSDQILDLANVESHCATEPATLKLVSK